MDKQQRGIQVIRIWLGVTMLIHGVMKVTSLEDTLAFFGSIGLPSLFCLWCSSN
ncbi:DoxX [Enterococcus faecalis]|nr:DoxX [Enterococcus faecalis]